MTVSKIGDFRFIALSQAPLANIEMVDVEVRPGVDGVSLWKLGKHRPPIQIDSVRDVAGDTTALALAAALTLYRSYEDFVGSDAVQVEWADVVTTAAKYVVIGVELIAITPCVGSVGGIEAGLNRAMLRCRWTLQPIFLEAA